MVEIFKGSHNHTCYIVKDTNRCKTCGYSTLDSIIKHWPEAFP